MSYIKEDDHVAAGCPFCTLPEGEDDAAALILYRGPSCYAILNRYPYNPGHLMAVPFRHVADFDELTGEELHEMADLARAGVRALRTATAPQAFTIGLNVGAAAGAGIAEHAHQHVVPRWAGDTNFMPLIGQTRILPELLEETYERLAPAFSEAVSAVG